MARKLFSLSIKFLLASLVVGFTLTMLGVTPRDIMDWIGITAQDAVDASRGLFDRAWTYIILGAAVVIPAWLVLAGIRYLRKRG